jgi:hypothetical protein
MPRGCGSIDQVFNVLLNLELNSPQSMTFKSTQYIAVVCAVPAAGNSQASKFDLNFQCLYATLCRMVQQTS